MTAAGITIVGASAGSGKTYRLTREVTAAIDPRRSDRIRLEGLVAVTFTRKASAELEARIRRSLAAAGAFDDAALLPLALVGTVHGACLRLLKEFALEAGLSPAVDVVAGDPSRLLREALEQVLSVDARETIEKLAARFALRLDGRTGHHDWLTPVSDIMDLARSNRIAPEALGAMAERSAAGLLALLPPPAASGDALDRALGVALAEGALALASVRDETKKTAHARDLVRDAIRRCRDDELTWSDWERLARIETARASSAAVVGVRSAASAYESHPRLHAEVIALTHALFDAACSGMSAYATWKRERRVLDYVDMIDGALTLASDPRVASALSARLRFVVVDELQDTSPIQLALFLRLHELAGRSVWVGDRKQCIFEYAGADPALMDAVAQWVEGEGGARDRLGENWRSRPELVELCSELFAHALGRHGFVRSEVVVSAARPRAVELSALPPLGLFVSEARNGGDFLQDVAAGVARMLDDAPSTPIVDRATGSARELRPGDLAVLVATNAEAGQLAGALHAHGIRTSLARAGLLSTPEGTLVDAALRLLLDPRDTLASATIDALSGFGGGSPDEWLARRLESARRRSSSRANVGPTGGLATGDDDSDGVDDESTGWRSALAPVRDALRELSPAEALDEVVSALDVIFSCARWPDPVQRIGNIDALRALSAKYEERCRQEREAATVAGLLRWFDDLRVERLHRDEMRASDDQWKRSDDGAITVCTYHKAKGLEWPVVILASLDRADRRHAFEVAPESESGRAFDPTAPLEGRWIRYWPWPLGALRKARLWDAADASAAGAAVADREAKERARLLYVGFTRARDHLVLALQIARGQVKKRWLDELQASDGTPILSLPSEALEGTIAMGRVMRADGTHLDAPARIWRVSRAAPTSRASSTARTWFERRRPSGPRPSYWIAPSRAGEEWPSLPVTRIGRVVRVSEGLSIDDDRIPSDVLGKAVHAFFAADSDRLDHRERLARAERLLVPSGAGAVVAPNRLLRTADALREWVDGRWPNAVWRREIPIECPIDSPDGARRLSGVIDLLLETPEEIVVLDHKTFPATNESAWRHRVKEFLPQMAAYATALERLGERRVAEVWIHLPLGGGLVEVVRA